MILHLFTNFNTNVYFLLGQFEICKIIIVRIAIIIYNIPVRFFTTGTLAMKVIFLLLHIER